MQASIAAVLGLAACGGETRRERSQGASETPPATPGTRPANARLVDRSKIADADLADAILDECHKPLRRRMQKVKVRVTLPDQRSMLVQADLPHRARVRHGKRELLLRDGKAYRLDSATAITAADDQLLRHLAVLVDAAAFGPIYRANSCRSQGGVHLLTSEAGQQAELELHDQSLLPRSLVIDGITVQFAGYLQTRTSWVANRVRTKALGTCEVYFEDGGVIFDRDFFDPPAAQSGAEATTKPVIRIAKPGTVRERESAKPIIVQGKATRWIVLKDPGDWQARHRQYEPIYRELVDQNQRIAGFPILFAKQAQAHLAVPFRQREDGEALAAPDNWQLHEEPRSRLLLVYPDSGSLSERIRTGTELLERTIANRKLRALGPILAQPFVHLHKGPPDEDKLADCKVRMSVRIE